MNGKLSRRDLLQVATGVMGAAAGARLGFLGDGVAWAATPDSLPWLNPLIKGQLQARVGASGTTIPGTAAALPNTGALRRVEGYVDDMSVNTGEAVTVRARSAMGSFVVAFLRMGWYRGEGALEVYRSGAISGINHPTRRRTLMVGSNVRGPFRWRLPLRAGLRAITSPPSSQPRPTLPSPTFRLWSEMIRPRLNS